MKYLKKIFRVLLAWSRKRRRFRYRFSEDIPECVQPGRVWIIGTSGDPWAAVLQCPCGCGKKIQLNMLKEASPCWTYTLEGSHITLKPSVWGKTGCRSHFFVRGGYIDWCYS
ncbi:DUF6527 family protein [Mucilaginibacter endophyticus]|uniref:DUF6527 family protein n=1 Tax=Mucilaginibacter endophyticus TaxID=2675003 RepID=UPI003CC661C7